MFNYHKTLRELLNSKNQILFFYTPIEEKAIKIIIRGSYDGIDIEEALKELQIQIDVLKIVPFSTINSRKNSMKLNLWLVKLKTGSNIKNFMEIQLPLNQKIELENPDQSIVKLCNQ